MDVATYEFPLSEKVRNYLRLELLFQQLQDASQPTNHNQEIYFFKMLFDLIEVVERLDLRADFIRDLDQQEKNLVHWSQHPEVDSDALNSALAGIHKLIGEIKQTNKFVSKLKEDKLLANVRQRFGSAGGATPFDLPSLFCWMNQPPERKDIDRRVWLSQLAIVKDTVMLLLSFLREKGRFEEVHVQNGFYQGNAGDKTELVRVKCDSSNGQYPVLSGNTYRYGIKFMQLDVEEGSSGAVADDMSFHIARC